MKQAYYEWLKTPAKWSFSHSQDDRYNLCFFSNSGSLGCSILGERSQETFQQAEIITKEILSPIEAFIAAEVQP